MYLGSRPAAAVVRWSARPDLSVPGLGLPDYNAGWPIHHGQSNKLKHHPYAAVSNPSRRGKEDLRRIEQKTAFLYTSHSLAEFQNWPKSEFELVAEEQEEHLLKECIFGENVVDGHFLHAPSVISSSEETALCGSSVLSKKESMEECQTVERAKSDDGISMGDDDIQTSSRRQPSSILGPLEGHDFLETELVFNRHVNEMKLALPVRSTKSGRPTKRQTGSMAVCRPSACRRRVHPVGKFTDELVQWLPQNGATDDEKDEDGDNNDVDFKHCIKDRKAKCNGSRSAHVNLKPMLKRSSNLSNHHPKRKRSHSSTERREGGIHRRRKQHNPWSIEETRMLIKGVSICGEGHWADIKRLDFAELASRSPVDLKDKWRNLLRLAQMTHNHSRNKKGEKRTDLPADMLQQVRMLGTYQK